MRLIDADALIEQMEADMEQMEEPLAKMFTGAAIHDVRHAPTVQSEKHTEERTETHGVCLDAISRQAAIDFAGSMNMCDEISNAAYKKLTSYLDELPSAQPERKTGHWKHINEEEERAKHNGQLLGWMPWYCSECGCGVGKHQTAFCPNCGADMRGERDE